VLLVRQRGGAFKGAWLLPGGGIETDETAEEAVRREVREETGLELTALHEIARYDMRPEGWPAMDVRMFAGQAVGAPRTGLDGEPAEWAHVDPATAHPVLLRELADAGSFDLDVVEIDARCRALGIAVVRAD